MIVYTDSTNLGGAEISLGHLVATANPAITVAVMGVDAAIVMQLVANRPGAPARVLPATGVFAIPAHLSAFRAFRPDVIHFNLCTPWACATGLTAALALPQIRVVRVEQLPLRTTDAIELWRTRWLSLRVDAHVAVGEASAHRMEDFYALGRNSLLSIPNGVPDLGPPPPLPERSAGELVLGCIGRLDPMKAQDVLLRAIAQVEGVRLVILGEGGEREKLTALARELGLDDRLEMPGWVSHPRDYLADFDALVLPSRSEGFPLTIVEAMLAARPVIATRVGSVPEAVRDGETGLLVEKNDVTGLAEAIRTLRDQPELRHRFGQQGRAIAAANWTVEQMTAQYEALWQRLVTNPQHPRLWVPRPRD